MVILRNAYFTVVVSVVFNSLIERLSRSRSVWEHTVCMLGLFFYLVGLHYPSHFDFGYFKKKKPQMAAKLSIPLYNIIILDIKSHYVSEITLDVRNKITWMEE